MAIKINGKPVHDVVGLSIGAYVDSLGRGRKGFAVAQNFDLIPKSSWDHTLLCEDDEIEILTAAQGG
jgi:sulfur carrier protein